MAVSKVAIYEKRKVVPSLKGDNVVQVWCYAVVTCKKWRVLTKTLYRTPDYPTFSMCIAALANFDFQSKILDCSQLGKDQTRQQRRVIAATIAKDLMKD